MNLHAPNVPAGLQEENGAFSQPRKLVSQQRTVYFIFQGVSGEEVREPEDCTNS